MREFQCGVARKGPYRAQNSSLPRSAAGPAVEVLHATPNGRRQTRVQNRPRSLRCRPITAPPLLQQPMRVVQVDGSTHEANTAYRHSNVLATASSTVRASRGRAAAAAATQGAQPRRSRIGSLSVCPRAARESLLVTWCLPKCLSSNDRDSVCNAGARGVDNVIVVFYRGGLPLGARDVTRRAVRASLPGARAAARRSRFSVTGLLGTPRPVQAANGLCPLCRVVLAADRRPRNRLLPFRRLDRQCRRRSSIREWNSHGSTVC